MEIAIACFLLLLFCTIVTITASIHVPMALTHMSPWHTCCYFNQRTGPKKEVTRATSSNVGKHF